MTQRCKSIGKARCSGIVYDVVTATPRKSGEMSSAVCGWQSYSSAMIYVSSRLPDEVSRSTILHECLHAVFPDWTEEQIDGAEARLFPFLSDPVNRDIINHIIGG